MTEQLNWLNAEQGKVFFAAAEKLVSVNGELAGKFWQFQIDATNEAVETNLEQARRLAEASDFGELVEAQKSYFELVTERGAENVRKTLGLLNESSEAVKACFNADAFDTPAGETVATKPRRTARKAA